MSETPFQIGMIGYGTVGRGVAQLLRDEADLYAERLGRAIELRAVLVRDRGRAVAAGLDEAMVTDDPEAFFTGDFDAVVEVAGGRDPVGGYVRRALGHKSHVVTANKAMLAAEGPELFGLARRHGVSIAFEASCGGGIPCVTALTAGLMANRVGGLYGILNGTCNYILTEMARRGKTYAEALAEAKDRGYAEADETLDVSGVDAAQKLAVLASLAFGARVVEADVPCRGIDTLNRSDVGFADELGYEVKLIAAAERWPGETDLALGTEPCLIARDAPLAQVHGSFNALSVVGHAVGHTMFYGRGAGQGPTASAVVADLLNVAAGAYPAAFAGLRLTPDLHDPPPLVAPGDLESRWYLRLDALDVPGIVAKVTAELAQRDISLASLLQHDAVGDTVPLVMTTHDAKRGDLDDACRTIAELPAVHGTPVVYRILDLPA